MSQEKVVYTSNGILLSLKRKEILSYASIQMNLEDVILSENSQSQKDKYYMILPIGGTKVVKLIETESRMVITSGWGEGKMGSCYLIGIEFHFCKMRSCWLSDVQQCAYSSH